MRPKVVAITIILAAAIFGLAAWISQALRPATGDLDSVQSGGDPGCVKPDDGRNRFNAFGACHAASRH